MGMDEVILGKYVEGDEKATWDRSLAFQGRVEEDDPSREDEECPDRVRVCCPGSQWTSVSNRRAWAINGDVKEDQGSQVTQGVDTKKVIGGLGNKLFQWGDGGSARSE